MKRGRLITTKQPGEPAPESIDGIEGKKPIYKTFRRGDRMPPHHAPVDVVVLVLEGEMELSLGDETGVYTAGEYTFFPARQLHALTCLEDAKIMIYK